MAEVQATITAWRSGAPNLREQLVAAIDLRRWLTLAMTTTLIAVAIVFAWRGASGSLLYPLSVASLTMLALVLGGMAAMAHWGGRAQPREKSCRRTRGYLISAAVLVVAIALSRPGTQSLGLLLLWGILLAEECWAWWPKSQIARRPLTPPAETPLARATDVPPPEVFQQLVLRQTAEGGQELSGWLRMPWVVGQRNGSLHVAFCPPFSASPDIDLELCEGPDAAIQVAQRFPYGMRLDLKRAAAAEGPATTLIQFVARTGAFEEKDEEVGKGE